MVLLSAFALEGFLLLLTPKNYFFGIRSNPFLDRWADYRGGMCGGEVARKRTGVLLYVYKH